MHLDTARPWRLARLMTMAMPVTMPMKGTYVGVATLECSFDGRWGAMSWGGVDAHCTPPPSRPSDIMWHEDNWHNDDSRFLAFTIKGRGGPDIYAAFNAHSTQVTTIAF